MQIRWSAEAADDFAGIIEYIRKQSPGVDERIAHAIYDSVSSLTNLATRGRIGRIRGTRELVLSPLPFIVVYRVREDAVEIVRLLHGSQRWP